MVTEVADEATVGANGTVTGLHVEGTTLIDLGFSLGASADGLRARPVPCPITDTIRVRAQAFGTFPWISEYLTFYNLRFPLAKVEVQASEGHTEWYELLPHFNGEWRMINIGENDLEIPTPTPDDGPWRFRLTSVYGETIVTNDVP